jgi:prepilin-type N-terminal cleavage/methylation domain-containing protein
MFAHSKDCAQSCGRNPWAPARTSPAANKKPLGTAERHLGLRPTRATRQGFSLVELMASMAILLVISGGMMSAISLSQQSFARTEMKSDMYENVRGVAELMAQEIGQAGLVSLPATTLGAPVTASGTAQAVTVSSTTSMYVGEQVLVDAGSTSEELVTVTAVTATKITGIFTKNHPTAVPPVTVNVLGVFPSGIVAKGTTDGSTDNVLNIFGDVNADGSLVYVRYTCTPGTSAAPGTLTRSVTTITPGANTVSASQTLLSTVIGGAGAVCFTYTQPPPVTVNGTAYTFVTNVGFTLSVQATRPDPQTAVIPQMTKSFLNLAPRDVLAGLELANAGITSRLQPTPANVLVY